MPGDSLREASPRRPAGRRRITARDRATRADRDAVPSGNEALRAHLGAAISWLEQAHDATSDGGVSAGWTHLRGWAPSFPETTGYIVPTLLRYCRWSHDRGLADRARVMVDWLVSLQDGDGAFPGGIHARGSENPCVFDTGQILFGLLAAHEAFGDARYLDAAVGAGNWLSENQSEDGTWPPELEFRGKAHVYNTRVAWALLLLHDRLGDDRHRETALRTLGWAHALGTGPELLHAAAFDRPEEGGRGVLKSVALVLREKNRPSFFSAASLHTLAYTIRGFLESGLLLRTIGGASGVATEGDRFLSRARVLAGRLASDAADDRLRGFYGSNWRPCTTSHCLTGVAQMALVWMRLREAGEADHSHAIDWALHRLLRSQKMERRNVHTYGGVAGSHPIYGLYLPFRYPNWAAKFAADAYMKRLSIPPERDAT